MVFSDNIQQTTEAEERRTRRGQRYTMEKKREKVITGILGSHCVCLCSRYRDVTLVEISVTLCWHSMERVREKEKRAEWEREKKKKRGGMFILFFFPPVFGLFPPFLSIQRCLCFCVCVCVCVYTLCATLESFTDYLTHVTSFWRAFNGGGLSGS